MKGLVGKADIICLGSIGRKWVYLSYCSWVKKSNLDFSTKQVEFNSVNLNKTLSGGLRFVAFIPA